MAKFLMLGKYSSEAIQGITAERTRKALATIEKAGGKVECMYALLGMYDLVFIANFPNIKEAMKTSIALTKATDICFSTLPAITVEEFDKMIG